MPARGFMITHIRLWADMEVRPYDFTFLWAGLEPAPTKNIITCFPIVGAGLRAGPGILNSTKILLGGHGGPPLRFHIPLGGFGTRPYAL